MSRRLFSTVFAIWLALVASGFALAWRYETTPGTSAARSSWPIGSRLTIDKNLPVIISFIHPSCPCTRAGLSGLTELARGKGDQARWIFVVVGAKELNEDLANSDNARLARRISGAQIILDPNGTEAKLFGARTSGQTFAFYPGGQEAFRGGVTSARGHEGPSLGLNALSDVIAGREPVSLTAPVYGCPLSEDRP